MMNALLFSMVLTLSAADPSASLQQDFANPPLIYKSHPLWFWNAPVSDAMTDQIMQGSLEMGYAGFGILPAPGNPEFMSKEFLDAYRHALDKAAELGMKMCLYDEYWFPSGSAGGLLEKQYPEALSKRLEKTEEDIKGPAAYTAKVSEGVFMGAVAMNPDDFSRVDISGNVQDGQLSWDAPEGKWKVIIFTCVTDGGAKLVDYLDPEAVAKFVALTYQKYYDAFPQHFGTTIESAFYDEPAMYHVKEGRAWTPAYNKKYEERFGQSPVTLYPALWYDMGEETAAARNALFGFRAELFSLAFPKVINDWCREHGVQLTGHVDQEEVVNPTGLCGDLIKFFEHQDMPGIDQISHYGRASKAYKVVSSAAYNYDRAKVMTETYGAMKEMPVSALYKEAMDQFAKGINVMIPHAVWYDHQHITFEPELSHRTQPYAAELPAYNQYVGRLQRILQFGRHVADIAVLYPIATLQAGYHFGVGDPYKGGIIPEEADYMEVGERLSLDVRRDFTFLHPETIARKCTQEGALIKLNNEAAPEEYRVFILPGSKTIHAETLAFVKRFFDAGGKVVATTQLPDKSAEPGRDAEVRQLVAALFGDRPGAVQTNDARGMACFIKSPTAEALKDALDLMLPAGDVYFAGKPKTKDGNLSYIHKIVDGRDFYFFANSSETAVDVPVAVRGKKTLEMWDPHTGETRECVSQPIETTGEDATEFQLTLAPVKSVFVVSR